jgi:rRNA maturation endonuclease Nob1
MIMAQQKLAAGTEASEGIYRCNACAKRIDLTEKEKLPQCSACGGFSWRTTRFYNKRASTK